MCRLSACIGGILMDGDVDGLIGLEDDSSVLEGREAHLTPSVVTEAVLLCGDTILARIEPIIAIGIMERERRRTALLAA